MSWKRTIWLKTFHKICKMNKAIMWFEKHEKLSVLITLLIAAAIFFISSISFDNVKYSIGPLSIIYHFSAFFMLAFFLSISLVKGKNKNTKLLIVVFLLAVAYGILDEIHQYFVPGRYSDLFDVGINSLGILYALMTYMISLKVRNRKSSNF